MIKIIFWWLSIYYLLMLIYIIYSAVRLRKFYLDQIKVEGTKVKFLPGRTFRKLIENMGIWFIIYLLISAVVGFIWFIISLF